METIAVQRQELEKWRFNQTSFSLTSINLLVPKLCTMVKEDDEVGVASICLESLTELLKECKSGVSGAHPDFPEAIVATVRAVLKSECACMDNEPEEGEEDEEESEQVSHTVLIILPIV